MRIITILLACLFASTAFAQLDVTVRKAKSVTTTTTRDVIQVVDETGVPIGDAVTRESDPVVKPSGEVRIVAATTEAANVEYEFEDAARNVVEFVESDDQTYSIVDVPGKYWYSVTAIDFPKNIYSRKRGVIEFGSPVPPPDPDPPGPTPGPAPIDGVGLRVLMIRESSAPLPVAIADIMGAKQVRDYLTANCIKVDGQPDWRMLDPDDQFTDPNHRFAKALKRPRASLPWLVISNGTAGYEGPFPATVTATLELLRSLTPTQLPRYVPLRSSIPAVPYSPFTNSFLIREGAIDCPECEVIQ